jgi:LuxR family maltose regulon positive regulatory protein
MFLLDIATDSSTNGELVSEKILRPSPASRIPRSRLLTVLNQSLRSCSSTIICGRAGTGKTALAIDFSLCCRRQTAWYKLDAPDGELRIFFQYLIASIKERRPGFGTRGLTALVPIAGREHIPLLAEVFAYELSEDESNPLLIVIEDLHHISDSEWLVPFFRRLLPLLPADVHVLITSRTMPPAPLWRMRSKQTLLVIDEDTLAFTRSEASELFESHGLTHEQATIALDHTHGRAAALAAFVRSLSKSDRQTVRRTADTRKLRQPQMTKLP